MTSYRLKSTYFINEWAARDLRFDSHRKMKMDEKVETDLIRKTERSCEEMKKQRSTFLDLAKRY